MMSVTDHSQHYDEWCHGSMVLCADDSENESGEIEFICNTIGCNVRKRFKFDIINIREVK